MELGEDVRREAGEHGLIERQPELGEAERLPTIVGIPARGPTPKVELPLR